MAWKAKPCGIGIRDVSRGIVWLMERARGLDIAGDLRAEFFDAGEFFFRAQVPSEGEFELLSVNLLAEIEEMNLEDAFAAGRRDGRTNANIDHSAESFRAP